MKPLNRPMFRYGGPIKEGVMSGIREPKKNGGLSKQFNTGLVGDERYPKTDGREHHYFFLPAMGMAALRMLAPRAIAAGVKQFGKGLATSPGTGTSVFGKGLTKMDRLKNLLPSGRFRQPPTPTMSKGASFQYKPAPLSIKESLRSPEIIGKAIRENPFTAFGVAGQVKNIPDIAGGAFDVAKKTALGGANYLLGTEFGKNKLPDIDLNADPNLGKTTKELGESKSTGKDSDGAPIVQLTDKEKRSQQIQKYRDIMDIKGMNKGAAYDSLIAASQAVNQAGGDLKGAIKDGSLINQIIQTTSKAFDKPAKTKDAIDTLILKGEIEKDIKASDPTNKLLNEYRLKQMEKIDKDLNTGFAEAKIAASKNLSGQAAIDAAASVASENFKGNLLTKTQLTDVMEKAKGSGEISEQDIIIAATQEVIKGKDLADGDYTVGDVLVTITEGQVTNIKR